MRGPRAKGGELDEKRGKEKPRGKRGEPQDGQKRRQLSRLPAAAMMIGPPSAEAAFAREPSPRSGSSLRLVEPRDRLTTSGLCPRASSIWVPRNHSSVTPS